mmetsp:Transcript_6428/g.40176  ORF Transcript_6428/g.40176 Transcript_6428/m.40176 type:complete len:104 (+) Transcript_6428:3021-3332(+)
MAKAVVQASKTIDEIIRTLPPIDSEEEQVQRILELQKTAAQTEQQLAAEVEKAEEELRGVQAMYRSLALALMRNRSDLTDLFHSLAPPSDSQADLSTHDQTHA